MLVMIFVLLVVSILVGLGIRWFVNSDITSKKDLFFKVSYAIICLAVALLLLSIAVVLF